MNFFQYKPCSDDLGCTDIENLFLLKYMPAAPGDYVKIYLLGLKYSQHTEMKGYGKLASNEIIAKFLDMEVQTVVDAWRYWEAQGILRIYPMESGNEDDVNIEFLSLRKLHFETIQKQAEPKKESSADRLTKAMENPHIKDMFDYIKQLTGRMVSPTEMFVYLDWIDDYKFDPFLVIMLVEECVTRGNKNISYMNKVAKSWYDNGVDTEEKAQEYIVAQSNGKMFDRLSKILGRTLTNEQMETVLDWINEYKFTPDLVAYLVEDCARRGKKEMPYIAAVASYWYNDGIRTVNNAVEYQNRHKEKWRKYNLVTNFLKCGRPNQAEEEMLHKWFYTYQMEESLVLFACEYVSKYKHATIGLVDRLIEEWHKNGVDTLEKAKLYGIKEDKQKKTSGKGTEEQKPGFRNFKNRSYDPQELKEQMLKKSRGENND